MKISSLSIKLLISLTALMFISLVQAQTPLWTFIPLTDTSISVARGDTATIKYLVTNQSDRVHILVMTPIPGAVQITSPGNCPNPFILAPQQSCVLSILVLGDALQDDVQGGPIVCQLSSFLQCYQPSTDNSLDISTKS